MPRANVRAVAFLIVVTCVVVILWTASQVLPMYSSSKEDMSKNEIPYLKLVSEIEDADVPGPTPRQSGLREEMEKLGEEMKRKKEELGMMEEPKKEMEEEMKGLEEEEKKRKEEEERKPTCFLARHSKEDCTCPPERTLVVVVGQLRGTKRSWNTFLTNLQGPMCADLFVCFTPGQGDPKADPFVANANVTLERAINLTLLRTLVDDVARSQGVEPGQVEAVSHVQNNWLGGLDGRKGSGLIHSLRMWECYAKGNETGLWDKYDYYVLARPDMFWLAPHIPMAHLARGIVWIPEGENWGGVNARHMVCSAEIVHACMRFLEAVFRGKEFGKFLGERQINDMNHELFLLWYFEWRGLVIQRFPNTGFLVADPGDPTRWSSAEEYMESLDVHVKYPSERDVAVKRCLELKGGKSWEELGVKGGADAFPFVV